MNLPSLTGSSAAQSGGTFSVITGGKNAWLWPVVIGVAVVIGIVAWFKKGK